LRIECHSIKKTRLHKIQDTLQAWLQATDYGRKAPELQDIGKMLGNRNWQLGYGTARREVGNWYLHAGRTGLEHLIAEVKEGRDLESALNSIASAPPRVSGPPSINPNVTLQK
jgi:hypothetical protein